MQIELSFFLQLYKTILTNEHKDYQFYYENDVIIRFILDFCIDTSVIIINNAVIIRLILDCIVLRLQQ